MSSKLRNMQRKFKRRAADYEPAPQPFFTLPDGGYMTLRPTKGWLKISGARLRAQFRMANLLGGK